MLPRICRLKTLLLLVLLLSTVGAMAQGCTQCRETVGQTPQRTQQAYQKAILSLIVASALAVGAGVVVVRRFR